MASLSRGKTLVTNTLILGIGQVFPQLAGLITLPIYTGMLTTAEYGRYDLVNVSVYILTVVVILQIHQAIFRFLIDARHTDKETIYISNGYYFALVPSILVSVVFGCFFYRLSLFTRFLLGFYLFLNLQNSVIGQISRGLGKNNYYVLGAAVNSTINVILVVLLVLKKRLGFNGLFISLDIALLCSCFIQHIGCKQYKKISLSSVRLSVIKEMLNYSWPMVPNTLSIWIINTCDKFIIRLFLGIEYNGVFAIAQKIPNLLTVAYGTFNMAWQESASLSSSSSDADTYYSNVFNVVFNFLAGVVLLLIAATPVIFSILINDSYAEAYNQIPILYVAVFLSCISSFLGSIYIAKKSTTAVGVSSIIGAVINSVVNISLVRLIGLYAASLSTVVSYIILVVYRMIDVKRKGYATIKYNYPKMISCMVLVIACCVLCFQRELILDILNLIIGSIVFFILNKSYIAMLLKRFKHAK